MKTTHFDASSAAFVALFWLFSHLISARAQDYRYEYREIHMGVAARLVVYAPNEELAQTACRAAFARVAQLEQIASDYRPSSELNQLCAQFSNLPLRREPIIVSPELFQMLQLSREISRRSRGLFDISAGPLVQLWRRARQTQTLPTVAEIADARKRVGWKNIELNPKTRGVRLKIAGMKLDLGAVAKGFAGDEAVQVLAQHKIARSLFEAGGDIVLGAAPPNQTGWRIETPDGSVWNLRHCAISTSGDSVQWVEIGGKKYSHIIDVRTGLGRTQNFATTVIAPSGLLSDSLSTAAGLLGPRDLDRLRVFPFHRIVVKRSN